MSLIFYAVGAFTIFCGFFIIGVGDIPYASHWTIYFCWFGGLVIFGFGRIIDLLETISIRLANDTNIK